MTGNHRGPWYAFSFYKRSSPRIEALIGGPRVFRFGCSEELPSPGCARERESSNEFQYVCLDAVHPMHALRNSHTRGALRRLYPRGVRHKNIKRRSMAKKSRREQDPGVRRMRTSVAASEGRPPSRGTYLRRGANDSILFCRDSRRGES